MIGPPRSCPSCGSLASSVTESSKRREAQAGNSARDRAADMESRRQLRRRHARMAEAHRAGHAVLDEKFPSGHPGRDRI
jgi:hypothetical protein